MCLLPPSVPLLVFVMMAPLSSRFTLSRRSYVESHKSAQPLSNVQVRLTMSKDKVNGNTAKMMDVMVAATQQRILSITLIGASSCAANRYLFSSSFLRF